jgi:hypothetical protein
MKTRTQMSLRHTEHARYTLVEREAGNICVIEDQAGRRARVKAEWLEIDGAQCWAGSFRKALHIKSAEWGKVEG